METVTLAAKVREESGKQAAKEVRRRGGVPAILYGHGMKPLGLELEYREFSRAIHTKAGANVLLTLSVPGVKLKESTCVIKELQHNPVTDLICHVDLTVISMTEKITVRVPLVVKNTAEAPGVKEGGVLELIHHEIEVECLPTAIPEKIEVDVKGMKLEDVLYVKDLAIPADVTCNLGQDEAVIAVHAVREEVVAPAEGEVVAAPEVIEKGKKPEEGAGTEAAAPAAADKAATKAEKK
ncbi:MAG: 50S ribosomal protein L25 [Candidatus Omnitrophota bacterium]|jgi:large subunit ribosomal protein L25